MSGATTTPVDRAHEAPIRDEIRRVNHAIESLQHSIGPLFDALSERLAHRLDADRDEAAKRLDAVFAKIDAARREDAAAVKMLINEVEERNAAAILAAHLHFSSEIRRVDGRIDDLDLRVGAHVGDNERERDEVTGSIKIVVTRVDTTERIVAQHETWFSKNKSTIGTGAGGAGLAIAVHSAAPYLVDWAKAAIHWIAP